MSGVAEGIAGLTLSAISVAALFTTCIDCFNLFAAATDFERDYELLWIALAIQKLRLLLWGESVGLASRHSIAVKKSSSELTSLMSSSAIKPSSSGPR
jgi:hypothetical protein